MKKLLLSIVLLTAILSPSMAQRGPGPGQGMARIHAAKINYIADRLHLSPYQSASFIPLYDQYENEVRDTRQFFFKKYRGANPERADNATSRQWIDDNLDYQQQVIELKRKYNQRFLNVISPQQLADLYKAEREFNQMLMQRLRQQHNGGGRYNRMNGN